MKPLLRPTVRDEYAYSDSEAAYDGKRHNSAWEMDAMGGDPSPEDEFHGDNSNYLNRAARTGRQRKKLAARTKGGEFQTRRRKRRVYFCCVGSDIDVQKLFDYLVGAGGSRHGWQYQLYNDVLRLHKAGIEEVPSIKDRTEIDISPRYSDNTSYGTSEPSSAGYYQQQSVEIGVSPNRPKTRRASAADAVVSRPHVGTADGVVQTTAADAGEMPEFRITASGAQEVFVFDFGGVVFWGFSRGEETNLLKTIRMFVTAGNVGVQEFQCGEDDMAFFSSPDTQTISLANDVISLPEESVAKQRLSVSFAIAQSSVLSIFEARIDRKIEEYKYIPETLAAYGKIHLSERQLGMMIGEVFVIRHDVNLHTEILDTPDFFWKQDQYEEHYRMVVAYLEMGGRTEILNKRLDMLRELLDVLQQQMETAHATKLEWIVIYLIIVEVLLQGISILNTNGAFNFSSDDEEP